VAPIGIANSFDVGHHQQFLRPQGSRYRPGYEIGVDIISIALTVRSDRSDDRDVVILLEVP
jgi:hypothetical protein